MKLYPVCNPPKWALLFLIAISASVGLFVTIGDANGQGIAPPDDGSQITVSIVTFGSGEESWQRFGHNALWVRDPLRGIDTLYNYGKFSFEEENFIVRFIQGHLRYWVEAQDPALTFQFYTSMNRSIYIQDLALTRNQRVSLRDFLEWNIKPENAFYDYDYYTDNCSTRVRDAIDLGVGGEVKRQTHTIPTHATFRFHTQRLTAEAPWLYTALLLALGNPVDRPITLWEDMFIPMTLREHIRTVMIPDEQGELVPLVARERTVFESTALPPDAQPPFWVIWYLLGGVTVAMLFLTLERAAGQNRLARLVFAGVTGFWTFVIGMGGIILASIWLLTDHFDATYNENLFFVTPLALPLAILLPLAVYGRRFAARPALVVSKLVAGSALIGFGVQVFPAFDQVNAEIIALVLPPNVALCFALMRRLRARRKT
ncbi:MAG TPA: DUF4105 domain-containing protein [Nitrospirales bacterium]|nr:DUF4105 domain-containing protein [Nitrospirales bacterium]